MATFLLDTQIAGPGSGKVAELLSAISRTDSAGTVYYEFEYQVQKEKDNGWRRHNIAVICARDGVLYTFNAQSSASRWNGYSAEFKRAAESFVLVP